MMTDNANRYDIFAAGCTVVLSFAFAMLVYLAGIRPFDYSLAVYGILYALPLSLMAGGTYFGCASANGRRAERLPVYVIIVVMLLAVISDGVRLFGRPLGIAVFMSVLLALLLGAGIGAVTYRGLKLMRDMPDDDMDLYDDDMDSDDDIDLFDDDIDLFDSKTHRCRIDRDMNPDATEPDAIKAPRSANDSALCRGESAAAVNAADVFLYIGAALLLTFLTFSFYYGGSWHTDIFDVSDGSPSLEVVAPDESEPKVVGSFELRQDGMLGGAAVEDESSRTGERDRLLCELVCGVVNANRRDEIDRQAEIIDSLAELGVYITNDAVRLYHMDSASGGIRYTDVIAAHDTVEDTLLLGGGIRHISLDLTGVCPLLPYKNWISRVGYYDGLGISLYDTNDEYGALVDSWLYESADGETGYYSRAQLIYDNSRGVYHIYLDYVCARDVDGFAPVYEYSSNVAVVFAEYSGYGDFHGSASLQYLHTGKNTQRCDVSAPDGARSFEVTAESPDNCRFYCGGDIEF